MTTFETTLKRSNPNELSVRLAGKLLAAIVAVTLVMGVLLHAFSASAANLVVTPLPAPTPREAVMVKDENIRLGDVFQNVTQNADFVLAPAPQPGEELVWNTPTLQRIATAFNLQWQPNGEEVRIRRDAALVDSGILKAVVRDHLANSDSSDTYNIALTGNVPEVVVPTDGDAPRLELADFNMQPAGGTFSAIVRVTGHTGKPQLVNLRGVAERMIRLPVVNASLRNGDIITAQNISWTTRKASSVRPDVVRTADALIGATPRTTLAAGETVRADSLAMPRMINRGDLVTMVFDHNGMLLTARGRALEDGAMGQVIKVSNTGSNRTIEGRVTNTKEITVN